MIKRTAIINNYAVHYRLPLLAALSKNINIEYYFFASSREKQGIKSISPAEFEENNIKYKEINTIYFYGLDIWQNGVIKIAFKKEYNHYIFNGDMYCLSTWLGAMILRVSGIKVTFWGHGLYGNEGWLKKKIRLLFYKIPNSHLLYSNRAKEMLIKEDMNSQDLYVVYNSLDYELQKRIFNSLKKNYLIEKKNKIFRNNNYTILFIGRITKEKRLDLLINALKILKDNGIVYNLLVIGDGPDIKNIKINVLKYGLNDVEFWGPCYNEKIIGELIGLADLTVSPGNIGLTAVHSLSYGTPVITHDDLTNQMPEVEIIEDGITGSFFDRGNVDSLSSSIHKWFEKNPDSNLNRRRCRVKIDKYYNPNYQITVFNDLVLGIEPKEGIGT
jgi:glycosyltransferase involved in cell wall biosynthesis